MIFVLILQLWIFIFKFLITIPSFSLILLNYFQIFFSDKSSVLLGFLLWQFLGERFETTLYISLWDGFHRISLGCFSCLFFSFCLSSSALFFISFYYITKAENILFSQSLIPLLISVFCICLVINQIFWRHFNILIIRSLYICICINKCSIIIF